MEHLSAAHEAMLKEGRNDIFWDTYPNEHAVKFIIQDGPIGDTLINLNGCQAEDMLAFVKHLFVSLNNTFESDENHITINALNIALDAQKLRTKDREKRGVEGTNAI